MRNQRRYGYLALLVSTTLVLAACQGGAQTIDVGKGLCRVTEGQTPPTEAPPEATGTSELLVGVVTDVGTLDDRNFNQYSWEGAQHGAATIGAAEPEAIITTDESEYAANIQSFVDQNYD
ncbi:MAG: hypothetical protein ACRDFR_05510, partial [Candidatus Limnocylindria bacterium]